jgi:FKBP-type peptidyl-prolyl cis-trans isomerase FkpA
MQKLSQLAQSRMLRAAEKQKELAKPFLEKAATEKGARKTASGMIYTEIKASTGAQPKATDIVKIHYAGTFIDGKEFDSSVKHGQPLEISLGQVIPCWTEGVGMMKVGGKAKLVCPSDLAYGDRGRPPIIPGGATLIFEVELLDVKAAPASAPKMPPAPKPKASPKK